MSFKGKHHSEETKRKLSELNKGEKHPMFGKHISEEHKKKFTFKGKHVSEETKKLLKNLYFGRTYEDLHGLEKALEIKKKMSESHRGRDFSEETKKKLSEALKGRKFSEEHRRKIGVASKGRKHSEEMKKNWSVANSGEGNPMFGKNHSEETKKKIAKRHIGKRLSDEHRRKISENNTRPMLGKHPSEETLRKMSIALKGRKRSPEAIRKNSEGHKGKHHSEDTKIKLRDARAKQILPKKDSVPEKRIQEFLFNLNINFVKHKFINIPHKYVCDIFIPSMNLVIECDGIYWHGHPDFYPILNKEQILKRERDTFRNKELCDEGFKVLRLWENEINRMSIDEFREILNNLGDICGD